MGSLIKFELKKIFSRRVTQVSCVFILVMFIAIMVSNISLQYAPDPNELGVEFEGTEAITQIKANADALAGPITDEVATEKLRAYKEFISPDGEIKDEYRYNGITINDRSNEYPNDEVTSGDKAGEYWKFHAVNYAYLSHLVEPWMEGYQMPVSVAATIDTTDTVDLYGQIRAKVAEDLEANQYGFTFTDAEKDFWMGKVDSVDTPVVYGYAGGWEDFLNMAEFLIFALIAVSIACASVFNGEYQARTDAVILSTRFGKTRLGLAKVAAAFIATSIIYWIEALALLLVPLIFFGAQGANLPIQVSTLSCTYNITMAAASLICCSVGYLAALAMLGISLALSSRMRNSLGILGVAVAVVFVPMFIPNVGNNVANHIVYLFPHFPLNPHTLFDPISYSVGPVVIEYPMFCLIVYAILFVAGSLFAMRIFKKHQVA